MGRLAGDVLFAQRHAVHPLLDEPVQTGGREHVAGVGARRHHGHTETRGRDRLQVAPRPVEHLGPIVAQQLVQHVVLAVAQAIHRLGGARVIRGTVGYFDGAAAQKRSNAVFAFLAVHIRVIVRGRVEGNEFFAGALGSLG